MMFWFAVSAPITTLFVNVRPSHSLLVVPSQSMTSTQFSVATCSRNSQLSTTKFLAVTCKSFSMSAKAASNWKLWMAQLSAVMLMSTPTAVSMMILGRSAPVPRPMYWTPAVSSVHPAAAE